MKALRACTSALLAFTLAGCPAASNPTPTPSTTASSTAPAPGGTLTIAYPNEPPTLSPLANGGDSTATRDIVQLLMPSLYAIGDDPSQLPPELAAAPPAFDDRGMTFRLAPGARWSDGNPITIEDVRATWRAARQGGPVWTFDRYRPITGVSALADGSILVGLPGAQPEALSRLFSAGLGVLPARSLADSGTRKTLGQSFPISGGPFVLKRWRKGLDMTFERNPHAFGPLVPKLDRLRIVFVPDAIGALTLFKQGKVDALGPYTAADWARRAATIPGAQVVTDTGATVQRLLAATGFSPLAQKAVRRAFVRAFDRTRTIGALVGAEGALAPCDDCGPYSPSFARSELERAEWRGRPIRRKAGRLLSIVLAIEGTDELAGYVARAMQRQVALVGFDVQVIALNTQTLWSQWLHSPDDFHAAIVTTRAQDLTELQVAYDLATLRVSMVARTGVTITSDAGPDGPFSGAPTWSR